MSLLQWGFVAAGLMLEAVIVWAYVMSPPMPGKAHRGN
jgi:hypothetical protein